MSSFKSLKKRLLDEVAKWSLLKHPFYEAWREGSVPIESLREYAIDYGEFITNFPRFWESVKKDSRGAALEGDIAQVIADEEHHARLWERFRASLGEKKIDSQIGAGKRLSRNYDEWCAQGFAEALGALFAFESQAARVAHTKYDGLVKHYGITGTKELAYFREHFKEDETHLKVQDRLLVQLTPQEQEKCLFIAGMAAHTLYHSLDDYARLLNATILTQRGGATRSAGN